MLQKMTSARITLLKRWFLIFALLISVNTAVAATPERLPIPAELERDVQFWIRVYSEITTSEGFIHDERNLAVVYRKVSFRADVTPTERRDGVDAEREKIQAMLRRLAAGAPDLTEDELAIQKAFGDEALPSTYTAAINQVRFQLGQADRFREGLERSGTWESHIADTFANRGLPPELSALPHVESSFDPTAYSKVGAAGLWQFMRSTGRRYLRIDDAVDERLDPFRATEAAAQLLDFNYRLLGSWPLALTAYNHGAAGMRRARDAMGTSDIATIVRRHRSPSFGFASRNFYVSFLAALTIDRNPEKYFGNLSRQPEMQFAEVTMPAYVPLTALQRVLKLDRAHLVALNPALRPPVWDGRRLVPRGYRLRLPVEAGKWTPEKLAADLGSSDQFVGQPRVRSYRVRSGETLASIARSHRLSVAELARLNNLDINDRVRAKRTLRLPDVPPALVAAAEAAVAADEPAAVAAADVAAPPTPPREVVAAAKAPQKTEQQEEAQAIAQVAKEDEPISAAQARASSPSLLPGGAIPQASDPVEYAVSATGSVLVAADETLGHYAEWLGVSATRLRTLNGLKAGRSVPMGRAVKLDLSRATKEQFEAKRRAHHQSLQAEYFTDHRIVGTEVYVARRGDSLWAVTQRYTNLPTWLLLQYNPDIDFADLRAGIEIVIPKVEALAPV
jgi:membrane-bound lytic murein transglycosylase D